LGHQRHICFPKKAFIITSAIIAENLKRNKKMSEFFIDKPEYFQFLSTIEQEREMFNKMHQKCVSFSKQAESDFKSTMERIRQKVRPMTKSGTRPKRIPISDGIYPRPQTVSIVRTRPNTANLISNQSNNLWPVRKSNAKRIYEPEHNNNYREDSPKRQLPLLVGQKLIEK